MKLRMASEADAAELVAIYAPYVTGSAVSFEYVVPSVEEFAARIAKTLEHFPYLVAEVDGEIVGYAYASPFHARAAYAWCAETSIYIKETAHGQGVGHQLYRALEALLKQQGYLNLYACIAYPNPASIAFHASMGYETIGHFHQCGFKRGEWYDMIWMEKMLGEHPIPPQPVKL